MTLAEFLLARIAEDEKDAEFELKLLGDDPNKYDSDYPGHLIGEEPFERMLAECEAKRRVVEKCVRAAGPPEEYPQSRRADFARAILLTVAQPYARHPDFREEWHAAIGTVPAPRWTYLDHNGDAHPGVGPDKAGPR
jgi:hypothetical protein